MTESEEKYFRECFKNGVVIIEFSDRKYFKSYNKMWCVTKNTAYIPKTMLYSG